MNGTSNFKSKFLNLTNLHLLWQLFLKTLTQFFKYKKMSIIIEFKLQTPIMKFKYK